VMKDITYNEATFLKGFHLCRSNSNALIRSGISNSREI
jgi:hypothetical protein